MSNSRIAKFVRLPLREKVVFLEACGLLLGIGAGLRLLPFRFVLRMLKRSAAAAASPRAVASNVPEERIIRLVEAGSCCCFPSQTCLTRALAARILLARHGQASQLRIGVSRDAKGALDAHAWLEKDGRVILGGLPDLARFTAFPSVDGKLAPQSASAVPSRGVAAVKTP